MNPPSELRIDVTGTPAPQGSKKGFPIRRANGTIGVAMTESAGDRVKTWRQDIRAAAMDAANAAAWIPPTGPVVVNIDFYLPRPKSHFRTGRNAGLLRDAAPTFPAVKPDGDKLLRATLDALTSSGVIIDDSRVVGSTWWKHYADSRSPGALISLIDLDLLEEDPAA